MSSPRGQKYTTTYALIIAVVLAMLPLYPGICESIKVRAAVPSSKVKTATTKQVPAKALPKALGADCAGPKRAVAQASSDNKTSGDKQPATNRDGKPVKDATANKSTEKPVTKTAYDGLPVLDPGRFFGAAMVGYASAKAAPEVMANLFCYCGCDETDNHSRLIDCFTSVHGVDCHICQEEAVKALKLNRDGVPMADIQQQIDEEFSHHYPFQEDTATYKKYKAGRLWKGGDKGSQTAGPPEAPSADATNKDSQPASKPKVKPGHQVGNCCGKEEHK